jgi:hypothetical protein
LRLTRRVRLAEIAVLAKAAAVLAEGVGPSVAAVAVACLTGGGAAALTLFGKVALLTLAGLLLLMADRLLLLLLTGGLVLVLALLRALFAVTLLTGCAFVGVHVSLLHCPMLMKSQMAGGGERSVAVRRMEVLATKGKGRPEMPDGPNPVVEDGVVQAASG